MSATLTHVIHTRPLVAAIAAPFRAFGRFLIVMAENNGRVKEVQYLSSLSDAQLAARGLKREDIARHVFHDVFFV